MTNSVKRFLLAWCPPGNPLANVNDRDGGVGTFFEIFILAPAVKQKKYRHTPVRTILINLRQ